MTRLADDKTVLQVMLLILPIVLSLIGTVISYEASSEIPDSSSDVLDWDELVFTQEWGFSACRQFKDRSDEGKTCRYEGKPSIWSIHGIWPTKKGTSGPNFCSKVTFDQTKLATILPLLRQFWYEIDDSKDEHKFWEHEWVKHGSCAKELDTFSTELKYFNEALNLRHKLDLYTVLKLGGGIIPDPTKGYTLDEINQAFKTGLGTTAAVPYVQCLKTKNDANEFEHHLLAIEVCLDKDLSILDCSKRGPKKLLDDSAEPCPKTGPILYQDYTPPTPTKPKDKHSKSEAGVGTGSDKREL